MAIEDEFNGIVGKADKVLFGKDAVAEDVIEVTIVALGNVGISMLGVSPIGTISNTDKAHGPPQIKLLSPGRAD